MRPIAQHAIYMLVLPFPPFYQQEINPKVSRWPGSYFIREPMQYLTSLNCQQNGNDVSFKRKAVDAVEIKIADPDSKIIVNYRILGIELSVRSTHIDSSHLHMMPPFTFLLPTDGIESSRINKPHQITVYCPKVDSSNATQTSWK